MAVVTINISAAVDALKQIGGNVVKMQNEVAKGLALEVMEKWRNLAQQGLSKTRDRYIRGIGSPKFERNGVYSLSLIGVLPNMIEQGMSAFDMKTGFANSRSNKKHITKDGKGWYMSIPFQWATAAAVGESELFSNKMTAGIERQVGNSLRTLRTRQGVREMVQKLPNSAVESGLGVRLAIVDSKTNVFFEQYTHKTPLEQGLQRVQKVDERGHSQYHTFRRVSNKSDPNSWIHKGLDARNFMGKAKEALDSEFGAIADDIIATFF